MQGKYDPKTVEGRLRRMREEVIAAFGRFAVNKDSLWRWERATYKTSCRMCVSRTGLIYTREQLLFIMGTEFCYHRPGNPHGPLGCRCRVRCVERDDGAVPTSEMPYEDWWRREIAAQRELAAASHLDLYRGRKKVAPEPTPADIAEAERLKCRDVTSEIEGHERAFEDVIRALKSCQAARPRTRGIGLSLRTELGVDEFGPYMEVGISTEFVPLIRIRPDVPDFNQVSARAWLEATFGKGCRPTPGVLAAFGIDAWRMNADDAEPLYSFDGIPSDRPAVAAPLRYGSRGIVIRETERDPLPQEIHWRGGSVRIEAADRDEVLTSFDCAERRSVGHAAR